MTMGMKMEHWKGTDHPFRITAGDTVLGVGTTIDQAEKRAVENLNLMIEAVYKGDLRRLLDNPPNQDK